MPFTTCTVAALLSIVCATSHFPLKLRKLVFAWQEVHCILPFPVVLQLAQSGSAVVQSVQLSFFIIKILLFNHLF
jgi:hypothetical protein